MAKLSTTLNRFGVICQATNIGRAKTLLGSNAPTLTPNRGSLAGWDGCLRPTREGLLRACMSHPKFSVKQAGKNYSWHQKRLARGQPLWLFMAVELVGPFVASTVLMCRGRWMSRRCGTRFGAGLGRGFRTGSGIGVVVLVVDLTAGAILLAVDLLTLLAGESAAVGDAVVVDLAVDIGLALVGASCFAGGHLATAYTVRNALLLVGFTLIDLRAIGVCSEPAASGRRVARVRVEGSGCRRCCNSRTTVIHAGELSPILRGERLVLH